MTRPVTMFGIFSLLAVFASPASAQTAREVSYTPQSVIQLRAKLRFTTMVILPEQEEILDYVCGDKEFWVVSGAQNLAYVKPAKAGTSTNLNLVTATGNVYSFLLTEGTAEADLKLYVVPDATMKGAGDAARKFYSAAEVDELRQAADAAKKDAQAAREGAAKTVEEQVNTFKASYPTRMEFPYRFKADEKPFLVTAIYTDGTFTYIKSQASELPALYEVRDGAPNLVNFQVEHGVYIVPKVLESGYLAVGKQRLAFHHVGR
jgi:type IV secretory pathway VirB9-like protein